MKTYLINLDRATERLDFQKKYLPENGIEFEKFSAVDAIELRDNKNLRKYFTKYLSFGENGDTRPTTGSFGQSGCAASHFSLWEKISNSEEKWTIVMEDDVRLCKTTDENTTWMDVVSTALNSIDDVDLIWLGWQWEPWSEYNDDLVLPNGAFCTHCYAITPIGAKKLLETALKGNTYTAIDIWMLHQNDWYKSDIRMGRINHTKLDVEYLQGIAPDGKSLLPGWRTCGGVARQATDEDGNGTYIHDGGQIKDWLKDMNDMPV